EVRDATATAPRVTSEEPVAIVGMALRLPGGAGDAESFWSLLEQERDAVVAIPESRWDSAAIYDPDPESANKSYVRHAAMLEGVEAEGYAIQGTSAAFAAGRLAFTLGLQGPALSVDTACSSSLVALHLACQALRRGECDLALAAGAQVMSSAEVFVLLSR